MVLDYQKVCGACSTPLTSPPRDGIDSMCAYLHTKQGRAESEATLKRNEVTKRVIVSTQTVTSLLDEVTWGPFSHEVTVNEVAEAHEVTGETKQQRYRRLNRERINQAQQDRRNHT